MAVVNDVSDDTTHQVAGNVIPTDASPALIKHGTYRARNLKQDQSDRLGYSAGSSSKEQVTLTTVDFAALERRRVSDTNVFTAVKE